MGTTLQHGIFLPAEGERNCYAGLASNWTILDGVVGGYSSHAANLTIHVTAADKEAWNGKADNSALTAHTGNTTIHVTAEDKEAWNGKADNSALTAHTGDTTIHVTSADKQAWNGHIADTDIHVTTADKNKWNNQTYVFRYSSTALVASSTNSNTLLDNTDNLKVGDKVIDSSGVIYSVTAIDTANSTFTIGTSLIDLAQDSDVVHKSGDEYITGTKTFGRGTLIVDNGIGNNIHGEIKLSGSRPGYIVADNSSDGVFNNNNCGVSILLQDAGKPLHIGGYKVDSNGRVFVDNTNKTPVLSITSSLIKTTTLVPENDTSNIMLRILSELNYANGNPSKTLDVRFIQFDDANASSAIYSNNDGKTALGVATRRWSKIYGTEYYYGANNVEFSSKFVTTDTAQTISGNKTFSSINGVEPSSLSLPSGNLNDVIDISSYISALDGTSNSYTVPANGWISIAIVGTAIAIVSSSWSDSRLRASSGDVRMLYPVLKNETLDISVIGTTLAYARFIPCQGNI